MNIQSQYFLNKNLKLFLLTSLFFFLIYISSNIRGIGWDGDSIVNIHQFYKLANSNLYNGPDGGTTPKLLPIILYGLFHFTMKSYSIHFISIILCSYAFARSFFLSKNFGGGWIWLILPFISPRFLNAIISADNTALSIGFYLLSLVALFEKKILFSFIFLLFAEFSRPGYSVLMPITLFYLFYLNNFGNYNNKKFLFIIILIALAFLHSFFCYLLSYESFLEYNQQNWGIYTPDGKLNPYEYVNNKINTAIIFFKGFITAIFSNIILPFPLAIITILLLFINLKKVKHITTIFVFLPCIFFPLLFAGLTKGTMTHMEVNPKFLPSFDKALDPSYFITILPILLFSISISFNKFVKRISFYFKSKRNNYHELLNKILKHLNNPFIYIFLAFNLAIANGLLLKDRFDYNPIKPNLDKNTYWLSSKLSHEIFDKIYSVKKTKINVLISCDPIPILIDNALMIKNAHFISNKLFINDQGNEYIKLCNQANTFKKRTKDILLNKKIKLNIFKNFDYDIIYAHKDIEDYFEFSDEVIKVNVEYDRVIFINEKYKNYSK